MSSTKDQLSPMNDSDDQAFAYAMVLSMNDVVPMVLTVAIELSLFDIIATAGSGAHISPSEIASHLQTENGDAPMMLDGMLRLLASHSILSCVESSATHERLYGLAPVSEFFVRNRGDGRSLAPLFLPKVKPDFGDVWNHLKDAILEGGVPFVRAHRMSIFELMDSADPAHRHYFSKRMGDLSDIIMNRFLQTYKGFEGLISLVDVGGGYGKDLNMIISKYPSIKGINLDLPSAIEIAPPYHGIEHVAGNMFESIPKAEAIFMKWICHNWDDEHCCKLLSNCYEALPKTGKVIMIDCVMPLAPDTSFGTKYVSQLDNVMLTAFGGKERTIKELEALSKSAGFSEIRIICRAYTSDVMELYK